MKELYKLVATDLSKEQALDVVHKIIQAINFTGNLKSWAKWLRQSLVSMWNTMGKI